MLLRSKDSNPPVPFEPHRIYIIFQRKIVLVDKSRADWEIGTPYALPRPRFHPERWEDWLCFECLIVSSHRCLIWRSLHCWVGTARPEIKHFHLEKATTVFALDRDIRIQGADSSTQSYTLLLQKCFREPETWGGLLKTSFFEIHLDAAKRGQLSSLSPFLLVELHTHTRREVDGIYHKVCDKFSVSLDFVSLPWLCWKQSWLESGRNTFSVHYYWERLHSWRHAWWPNHGVSMTSWYQLLVVSCVAWRIEAVKRVELEYCAELGILASNVIVGIPKNE